jgi:hypothetical protein
MGFGGFWLVLEKGGKDLKDKTYLDNLAKKFFLGRAVPDELTLLYRSEKATRQKIIKKVGLHLFEEPVKNFAKEFVKDLKDMPYYNEFYAGRVPSETRKAYLTLLNEMVFFGINGSYAHYLGYWSNHISQVVQNALITLSYEDGKIAFSGATLSSYLLSIIQADDFLEVRENLISIGFQDLPNSQNNIDLEMNELPNLMNQLRQYEDFLLKRNTSR